MNDTAILKRVEYVIETLRTRHVAEGWPSVRQIGRCEDWY
jgi:hypothetical protein